MSDKYPEEEQNGRQFAPWERTFDKVLTPFEEFVHNQTTSGLILMISAITALLIANSPWGAAYHALLELPLSIGLGEASLSKSLHHWINDGLMTLFFFLVGLEIKREVLAGELSDPRQAVLPALAAIGGMAAPALLFLLITGNDSTAAAGWGVPMATDIAFAVGALAILGKRVPPGVLMFLVALAIVDDLGAIVVIAVFYSAKLSAGYLLWAGLCLLALVLLNLIGIRKPLLYFAIGTLLWFCMLKSGVHATIAGVLIALTIPSRAELDSPSFSQKIRELLSRFDGQHHEKLGVLANPQQHAVLQSLENKVLGAQTPLQRLEHNLHLPVSLIIMPIFALANAGIPLNGSALADAAAHPLSLAIVVGLLGGKLLGVAGVSWVALKLGLGRLPPNTQFSHIIGVALLAGIGFTMSIFIADLAFIGDAQLITIAKTGILAASLLAGGLGYLWFLLVTEKP